MVKGRGRAEQLAREKADHPTAKTSGEVRGLLNVSEATWKRWRRNGTAPPPAYHSVSGWPLWSAAQVTDMLRARIERLSR